MRYNIDKRKIIWGGRSVDKILQQILEGQTQILTRLENIENTMVTKVIFEKSYLEGQKDIMAILERTATKESIVTLDSKFDVLNNRLFQQEAKILSLVK